jgi:hypothetical protein
MSPTKQIDVETDVFAGIWAQHQPGEQDESAILRRILKIPPIAAAPVKSSPSGTVGITDPRFDIKLPEGFEIFRIYKGVEHRAKAIDDGWLLASNGKTYPSINQLSRAVSGNVENAWRNWYFMGSDGKRYLVEKLRNDIVPNVRRLAPLL